MYFNKRQKTSPETSLPVLKELLEKLRGLEDFSEDGLRELVSAYIQEKGVKNGVVLWPLRIALSGKEATPGGAYEIGYLLGKDESLARLETAISRLETM
jgi:glutamyl-tRNA synthetase